MEQADFVKNMICSSLEKCKALDPTIQCIICRSRSEKTVNVTCKNKSLGMYWLRWGMPFVNGNPQKVDMNFIENSMCYGIHKLGEDAFYLSVSKEMVLSIKDNDKIFYKGLEVLGVYIHLDPETKSLFAPIVLGMTIVQKDGDGSVVTYFVKN